MKYRVVEVKDNGEGQRVPVTRAMSYEAANKRMEKLITQNPDKWYSFEEVISQ